jgi:hypothetical protein
MLREWAVGESLWEPVLPRELRELPPKLAKVDVRKGRRASRPCGSRFRLYGAAQESNLPSVGLPRLTGFERFTRIR